MSYPDLKYYITFFFQRYKDFEKSINSNRTKPKGRPKVHSDSSLVVFLVSFMELRGINRFKAQYLFLLSHQDQVKQFKFKSVPDRTTLSRRYKQLAPRIEQFIAYLGDLGVSLDTQTPEMLSMKTKVSINPKAACGIKRTEKQTTFLKGCVLLIQMRVGQQASIAVGFMAMDFISQPLPTDFHGSLMFGQLL